MISNIRVPPLVNHRARDGDAILHDPSTCDASRFREPLAHQLCDRRSSADRFAGSGHEDRVVVVGLNDGRDILSFHRLQPVGIRLRDGCRGCRVDVSFPRLCRYRFRRYCGRHQECRQRMAFHMLSPVHDTLAAVSENLPTRREILRGMAALPLVTGTLEAQAADSSVCFMSAIEMARLIRTKKLSAREALAAHLKQIERVNPKVNAIVTLVPEMAADAAAKADEMQARGEKLGALHGLPVAHKDLLETRGIRTTFGSPLYQRQHSR